MRDEVTACASFAVVLAAVSGVKAGENSNCVYIPKFYKKFWYIVEKRLAGMEIR